MGNTGSIPTSFSQDDPTQMQSGEWLQTYRHDPQVKTDRIQWGSQGSHLDIGAKVMQQVGGKDLYIVNAENQKVFLTRNGVQLSNAKELIKQDPAYGLGPMVEILGPPTSPQYYIWSGNQFSGGDTYQPYKINNMQDLQYVINHQTGNPYANTQHSGQYGEAAIAGPFQKRPRDFWTGVADAEKFISNVGMSLIVPIAADVISMAVPGFSMLTQVTGLQNDLGNAISNAQQNYQKSIQYKSGTQFDTSLSSVITDPRLNSFFNNSMTGYTNIAKETQNHDPGILMLPDTTPQQKLLKARALQTAAANMQSEQDETKLESLMAQLQVKYPKKLDWKYYNQMQSGLKLANNATEKLNVLSAFTKKLVSDVQNIQKQATNTPEEVEQPQQPEIKTLHESFVLTPGGPDFHQITAQRVQGPPLTGSGFQQNFTNPFVINGSVPGSHQSLVIHG